MVFYDFEVFEHDWLCVIIDMIRKVEHVVVNDPEKLQQIFDENRNEVWIGYNSRHYDQWIMKAILAGFNPKKMNDHIIVKQKAGWQFSSLLNKIQINNFDIMSSMHGLKQLEGFMGNSIKESSVPFNIDRKLTPEEIEEVVAYCRHDVEQTIEVFIQRKEEFESQLSLIRAFNMPLSYISKTKVQLAAIILDARKRSHDDEFDLIFPNTLRIEKYKSVLNWYMNPINRDYEKELKIDIAGVPHVFAWGGIHGAIPKYSGKGIFLNVDVASYYPALMIEYDFGSRNMSDPSKYRQIRDERLRLKAEQNPMQAPYKIVLNGTYGAMKDKNNDLFDPRQANNVCVGGQLLLLDLIERLEDHCQLIQSNTDGLILKLNSIDDYDLIDDICYEWEQRTRMELEFELFVGMYQKDVNNYVIVPEGDLYDEKGKPRWKAKGAYVKKLNALDYDLPIVNKAVVEYFLNGTDPAKTINECDDLKEFQKIVKVSSKYLYAIHGSEIQKDKCFRVFASNRSSHGGIFKVKEVGKNPEKFANTPERCFIANDDVNGVKVPRSLDRKWYIDLALKRIEDFGVKL